MNWYHEVSEEWLKARKLYLTATDIASLIPEYKRSLKAEEDAIAPGFAALWAEKNSICEVDTASYGAAARGHWMEKYAVNSWNEQRKPIMFHWDDCIIVKGRVGFSPDAMTELQSLSATELLATTDGLIDGHGDTVPYPAEILEIKSYEAAHHMKCVIADKMDQDQKLLIQIATAFYVLENLEKANLVFFCPGAPISMKAFEYTRKDLEVEIELVEKIVEKYRKTIEQCEELTVDLVAKCTEREVYDAMVEENELNRKDSILMF